MLHIIFNDMHNDPVSIHSDHVKVSPHIYRKGVEAELFQSAIEIMTPLSERPEIVPDMSFEDYSIVLLVSNKQKTAKEELVLDLREIQGRNTKMRVGKPSLG